MRSIEKAMVTWLDGKLAKNGLAQHAVVMKQPRILFTEACKACVGIREVGGNNRGALVELMQETLGSAGQEAWCMSYIQSCLAYAEVKTNTASPVYPSEHCLTVWNKTPVNQRVKVMPLAGAICIWRYGTSSSGHTGCVLSCDESIQQLCEGNTESGISGGAVVREGGGVYATSRSRFGSGSMKVVGWLRPW